MRTSQTTRPTTSPTTNLPTNSTSSYKQQAALYKRVDNFAFHRFWLHLDIKLIVIIKEFFMKNSPNTTFYPDIKSKCNEKKCYSVGQ